MWSFFMLWFKGLSATKKTFFVVVLILLMALAVQSGRLASSEYLRLKAIEKEYTEANEKVLESEKKELEIVSRNKKRTTKSKQKNQEINEKLKQDEKAVDNSDVSDDDIFEFISKHN